MSNIFKFEDHAKKHRFSKDVVDILAKENPLYEFEQDDDRGIAYLHLNRYIYIFFKYVPRGETTDAPTLEDSSKGVERNQRYSTGEWVVDEIVVLDKKDAVRFFPIIYSKMKDSGWIEDFKHRVIEEILSEK